ncbi:MAG: hypothetical protein WBD07_10615 [Vicinamibacterales bacterium]
MRASARVILALLCAASVPVLLSAQAPGGAQGGRGGPPPPPRQAAPIDLTGNWVSIVSEDWRWRMVTPLKGDSASIPINSAAKDIVNAWDPAADEAAGLQCKAYGAAAIMRVPGRLRISWQDDNTLKIETDAGTQTRLLHFGGQAPPNTPPSWQGYSVARWEPGLAPARGGVPLGFGARQGVRSRSLEVVTTNLSPGYLRKNGVPYSARTTLTEYFDRFTEPDGTERFTVMTIVADPQYLAVPFVTTSDFKKEADGSKWDPTPCSAR